MSANVPPELVGCGPSDTNSTIIYVVICIIVIIVLLVVCFGAMLGYAYFPGEEKIDKASGKPYMAYHAFYNVGETISVGWHAPICVITGIIAAAACVALVFCINNLHNCRQKRNEWATHAPLPWQ